MLDLQFPQQYNEIPQVYEAWIVLLLILVLIYIIIKNYRTKGLRDIEKWKETKKVDNLFESYFVIILLGIVFGIAAYQLLWKNLV